MKPPPSTPTPRRFLTKRPVSSQLSHSTPTPLRFQSTPRFGLTQSGTAARQVDDVEDIDVGTSPLQSQSQSQSITEQQQQQRSDGRDIVSDSIEVDSYADSLASQDEEEEPQSSISNHDDNTEGGDGIKRPSGDVIDDDDDDDDEEGNAMIIDTHDYEKGDDVGTSPSPPQLPPPKRRRLSASTSPTRLLHSATEYDSDTGHYEEQEHSEQDDDGEEHALQDKTKTRASAQQPTFQPAPRFKPLPEDELFTRDHPNGSSTAAALLLTAPFSPQRRGGARYLSGGMAAQLQGLLSQVKGWRSETTTATATALGDGGELGDNEAVVAGGTIVRLAVEEIVPGTRMHLVKGRRIVSRMGSVVSESEKSGDTGGVVLRNYILAGGGGGQAGEGGMVKEGSVLQIMGAPAWNVHLGEEEWTVACEWRVEAFRE